MVWMLGLCSVSLLALGAAGPVWGQTSQAGQPAVAANSNPDTEAPQTRPTPPPADASQSVVVTGFRRSLQTAESLKRNAVQIVDAVVAEDIGKLPDITASDSLARIVGVQVERGGGEANRVLVRGLPNITTTYNGRDIFTAEARFVAVQDFPAGGVAGLEVFKSTTAEQVEAGIAGLINVRSRRPFDFKGLEIAGGFNSIFTTQAQKRDWNGNILVSDRWDTAIGQIGALVNLSYTKLRYLDSARFDGGFIAAARPDQVSDPALIGARYPDAVGIFYGSGNRWRPSVNASVQWRPNDKLEFYADLLYQGYRNEVSDRQLFVPLFGASQFSNVVLMPGTRQIQSLTATNQVRPELFQGATYGKTNTTQVAVGGAWESGPLRVTADLAHTESKFTDSIYSFDEAFAFAPTVDVNFNTPEEEHGVDFRFRNFDVAAAGAYVFRGIFDRLLVARGKDIQFRTDATYKTGFAAIPQVDVGFRYVDRDGGFDNGQRYSFQEPNRIPLTALGLDLITVPTGFRGSDVQQTRTWVAPSYGSLRANWDRLRQTYYGATGNPSFDPVAHFDANERSWAGYGQMHYAVGPADHPIDGVLGLRVVRTRESITGNVVSGATVTPRTTTSEYTDYLPTLNARYRFTPELQLRLSANKTRTRPDLNQLNPGVFVPPNPGSSGRFEVTAGNVDLRPFVSKNYDAALEYYFSRTGFAALSIFRHDVSGFIANQTVNVDINVNGAPVALRLTQPVNLNKTTIQGAEAQLTTFFDYGFVPEWVHPFGVQLNATYLDAHLSNISRYAYNVVGMYERGGLAARLTYNLRTRFAQDEPGLFADDVSRLDFSTNYTPPQFPNLTFAFDVSNILGKPFRNFFNYGQGVYPRDVRFEEAVYSVGIRFRR